ncbi:transmembrane protein [Tieghemostelium lacteum]|uniref:Transmembrane protein n=1 Tax=Tieghemostelium lacteum TaxID=361077 RepID=A0A152A2U5_TIELA|nr:transmembrane protein [Tieghemostelium lacteum]|eukprot:KYR00529.1 transmembrane protein [Tieghemostelium lacteum]
MKLFVILQFIVLYIILIKCDSSIPNCTQGEEPILGDWGFKNIANNLTSPWVLESNSIAYFCTDDECGSPRYPLKGYYYAFFQYNQKNSQLQNYTLSQVFTLPQIPNDYPEISQQYYLEYFVSSSFPSNNNELKSTFSVYVDNMSLSVSTGVMVYGDVQRISLSPWIEPGQHTLSFQVAYVTQGADFSYDTNINGFQLSSVVIRREPVSDQTHLNATDVYVDVGKGSDINGNGTLSSPYSTIAMAMIWAPPDGTIWLMDGIYCGLAMQMSITDNTNIKAYNQNSTSSVVLSGEGMLSIFKISTSLFLDISVNVIGITIGYSYSSSNTAGGGALFIESQATANFINCQFISNMDYSNRGAISMRGSATLHLQQCIISNSSQSMSNDYGPAVSMLGFNSYSPILMIDQCEFQGNQQSLLVDQTTSFSLSNTVIRGTNEVTQSLCSLMISRVTTSRISNTTITDNRNCALCIIKSNTNITDSIFQRNDLFNGPGGNIYISQNSQVTMDNVSISESSGETGSAIFLMEYSSANIKNSKFSNITSQNSLISSSNSQIQLENSTISQCFGSYSVYMFFGSLHVLESEFHQLQGGIFATQTSIDIKKSNFFDIQEADTGDYPYTFQDCTVRVENGHFNRQTGAIYLSYTTLYLDDSIIENTNSTSNFVFMSPLSVVSISSCTFQDNQNTIFTLESGSTLSVFTSKFLNNINNGSSSATGSIALLYEGAAASFMQSEFTHNSAPNGGCFYMESNSQLQLISCTAVNNSAVTGGVIFAYSEGPNITITGGSYNYNYAAKGGGVIYYTSPAPTISPTTDMNNNTASYGSKLATSPTIIWLDTEFPDSFQSGITIFQGIVSIRDKTNQVVTNSTNSLKIYLQISGNTIVSAPVNSSGYAIFENVVLTGTIGKVVDIVFLSNQPFLSIWTNKSYVQPCPGGQIPSASGNICVNCSAGSYGYDGVTCLQCPSNAYCQDGNQVIGKAGYWFDPTKYPLSLYSCPNTNNCGYNNTCAPHTQGILCAECEDGYYNWGSGCIHCPNTSPIVYFAIVVGSILMILWVQRSDSESGLMTVIIYFFQTLMVLSTGVHFSFLSLLNLEFESSNSKSSSTLFGLCPGPYDFYDRHYLTLYAAPYLLVVLILVSIFTVILQKLIEPCRKPSNTLPIQSSYSNDNLIPNDNSTKSENNSLEDINSYNNSSQKPELQDSIEFINRDITESEDDEDEHQGLSLLRSNQEKLNNHNISNSMVLLPKKQTLVKRSFINQQLGGLIKLILNIYSPIAKAAFEMFFCEEISGVKLLIVDSSVVCSGAEYEKSLIVSYSLLAVIIGFPTILMILLFRQRHNLDKAYVQRIYGVFILKYKDSYYFWDVILLGRRLLIVLMSMMEPTSNERSFFLVIITLISVLIQFKCQPFKSAADNQLEFTSLTLLFICCVYLDNNIWNTIEQYVVIISAVLFGLHAIYIVYSSYRHDFIDSFFHYLHVITRGKHGRKKIKLPKSKSEKDGADLKKPLLGNSLDDQLDSDDDLDLQLDEDDTNVLNKNSIEL